MRKKELIKQLEKIKYNPTIVIPGYKTGFEDVALIEQKKLYKTESFWHEGTWQNEDCRDHKKTGKSKYCVCLERI